MYGLEEKDKFRFDLEEEIKAEPKKATEMLESVGKKIAELKDVLRKGEKSEELDKLGKILHAYIASEKILKKIVKS
jgi:hypothetical protein